jgi:predicted kinase
MMHPMDGPTEIRLPEPCLVVLVGAAGAGKSTFATRHFAAEDVLSSDAYRGLVAGDPTDQRATRPAFAALHRELGRRLRDGRTAVVDATNVTAAARATLLGIASEAGVPAVAIVLDLPLDVVLARNASRPGARAVQEPVVRRHLDALAAALGGQALEREGFAAVVRLRSPADVGAVRVVRGGGSRSGGGGGTAPAG